MRFKKTIKKHHFSEPKGEYLRNIDRQTLDMLLTYSATMNQNGRRGNGNWFFF